MKAKVDFLWYLEGDEIKDSEEKENVDKWIVLGLVDSGVVKDPRDLNNDGVIDSKDASIGAKTMAKVREDKKKAKKKKSSKRK